MYFFRTFYVLLLKDLLVALRCWIWTLFQLAVPILIGLLIVPASPVPPRKPADFSGYKGGGLFNFSSCSKAHLFYVNSGPDEGEIEEFLHDMPMVFQLITDLTLGKTQTLCLITAIITAVNPSPFTLGAGAPLSQRCTRLFHFGRQCTLIALLLPPSENLNKTKFRTTSDLVEHIEKSDGFGLVFESFKKKKKKLTYRVYSSDIKAIQAKRDVEQVLTTEVFSTELINYDLTLVQPTKKEESISTLQVCFTAAIEGKNLDREVGFTYGPARIAVLEKEEIKAPLHFLSRALPLLLVPILLNTALSAATDKEAGMKEFLVIMGLWKVTLFLECIVFSLLKVILVIVVVCGRLIWFMPKELWPIIISSLSLLALGIVLTGMLCAAVVKTGTGALTLSLVVAVVMVLIQGHASGVYNTDVMHYILLIDIFAAYENLVNAIRLHYVRGKKDIGSTLFYYDDIIDVGPSLIFTIADVVLLLILVLFLDYLSFKTFVITIMSSFHKSQLVAGLESNVKLSWHEKDQGVGEPTLSVDCVSKIWETTGEVAVRGFSMKAFSGQVTVLLGHNGAGKSTTYAMICGTTPATKGEITVLGKRLSSNICGSHPAVGFCPQTNCVFNNLTVEDHLWLFFILKGGVGIWKDEADILCMQLDMAFIMKKRAKKLSGGEKRKLCLAMAFIGGSKLVMLDEPTAGLDPQSRTFVKKMIEQKKKERAIVLTTHYLDEAEAMGDWIYIMYMGRSICSGTTQFLKAKFAPGMFLNVVFSQNVSQHNVDATRKIINKNIEGVKTGEMNGCQLRFELPRSQQKKFPKLFAQLENEKKSLQIESFGLSVNALEEAFLKVGGLEEFSSRNKEQKVFQDADTLELHRDLLTTTLQQLKYIWLKRFIDLVHNIPLIINQDFVKKSDHRVGGLPVVRFAFRGVQSLTALIQRWSFNRITGSAHLILLNLAYTAASPIFDC
ncbi:hypothetical protein Y032_0033g2695 [Ancylostoma ceylanicum]|uniref:ABC transporter domain-containing protein n=1 Tax=Ancylostoma ceylanicum TaxID=53326 RepID=A0A016UMU6_9BILA|nr:hypothetical protein Y032_0033g2695 [Ancylostoma ceylanicum]